MVWGAGLYSMSVELDNGRMERGIRMIRDGLLLIARIPNPKPWTPKQQERRS